MTLFLPGKFDGIYPPPPSFERGPKSPYAYAEYFPEGSTHAHITLLGGVLEVEEAATLLADAIRVCDEDRHIDRKGKGHGQTHPSGSPEEAFTAAVEQLYIRKYDYEWWELVVKIMRAKRWGGQPPAAVIMPTENDLSKASLLMEAASGQITIRDIAPNGLMDSLAPPAGTKKAEFGWEVPRKWSPKRRLAWMNRNRRN